MRQPHQEKTGTWRRRINMHSKLPDGFTSRPAVMEDAKAITELYNVMERWVSGAGELEEEELRTDWGAETFHMETDSQTVFNPDGQPVGQVELWDRRPPHVLLIAFVAVHPDYMQRGIGTFLTEWLETRAQHNLSKAPDDARVVLHQYIHSAHQSAIDLLIARNYRHIRDAQRMCIDFDQPPVAPEIPQGMVIRSICGDEDERKAMYACYEAFLDHRDAVDEPFESYYKRWKYYIDHDSQRDPSLWFIALDGDEVAGASICHKQTDQDTQMGWVSTLGVRRPWRKHGVGLALLQYSFQEFYRRGKPRVGLSVDATSLTGATRLYQHAGMYVQRTTHVFELELRGGKEYTRQSLE
jgi:mycothiol synthase